MWLHTFPASSASRALAIAPGEIEVVVTRLVAEPHALRRLTAMLSEAERERASRFVFDRDRRRFIVCRARLRQLLASRLGGDPELVEFIYGAQGKPSLARRLTDSDLRFNLSHSGGIAVYAFSWGLEVGVDVEAVRVIADADRIAARFFSPHEKEAYRVLDPGDKPLGFFNCWTRKEAFVKALGGGLAYPLDGFDVSLGPNEPAKILRVGPIRGDRCNWRMESFSPGRGFVAAVVSEKRSGY